MVLGLPHYRSLLYRAEQCYDKIHVNFLETVTYVDPNTLLLTPFIIFQTSEHVNQIPCENHLVNDIALDPDTDKYYALTPRPTSTFGD